MDTATLPQAPLLTRRTVLILLAAVGASTSFYLLLTAVPMYATSSGRPGSGAADAGLATGVLMLATVVAELAAPRLIDRWGRRSAFGLSLMLLGAPAVLLPLSAHPFTVLGVCALRGLGFGVAVVVGSAWLAAVVPARRRSEALGVYGAVFGIPAIVALPLGVWLAGSVGFAPVFLAGAAVALLALIPLAGLPGGSRQSNVDPAVRSGPAGSLGIVRGLRSAALVRPMVVFAFTALAAGIVATFLPLAATGPATDLVVPALLAQAGTATLSRWWAGRYGDRYGPSRVLGAGALVSAFGVLTLTLTGSAVAVVAGAAIFGIGFGIAQNASITMMFSSVPARDYDTASAVWNIGYDAGMGLGAAGFGLLASLIGFPLGLLLTAAVIPPSLALIRRRGEALKN